MMNDMKKKIKTCIIIVFVVLPIINLSFFLFKKDKNFKDMTLREKIGQMLMVYYTLDEIDDDLINSLKENQPGGFIVTVDNLKEYKKSKKFISSLNKYVGIDMIIAVDQEGGSVQRLMDISDIKATVLPSMYYVGKLNNTDTSYEVGNIISSEVASLGINAVFSPVVDIGNYKTSAMGDRLISNDTDIVTNNALSIYKGIESNNVISIAKHFPGLGDAAVDTHDNKITIVNKTKEELYDRELKPFVKLIDSGIDMIMVGHASYPKITGDNTPASLSKTIVTDLLINELSFNGIVIADAINMGAIASNYNESDTYIKAINAGVNMFVMPNGSKRVIDLIEKEVMNGNIDENKINESVIRILNVKKKRKLNEFRVLNKYGLTENKKFICNTFSSYCSYNK